MYLCKFHFNGIIIWANIWMFFWYWNATRGRPVSYFCFSRAEKNEKSLYAQYSFRNLIKKLYKTPSALFLPTLPFISPAADDDDWLSRRRSIGKGGWNNIKVGNFRSAVMTRYSFYVNHKANLHFRFNEDHSGNIEIKYLSWN